jgi:hypothetical protein
MRIFVFASRALSPVIVLGAVTLASSTSHAAAAPAAATKRASHRVLPAPLPAPLPKVEPLPQLPPVARDVTAVTSITLPDWTTAGASASGAASSSSAQGGGLPPLPAAETLGAAGARPGADVVSTVDTVREVKPSGFVVQIGGGVLAPTQSFVSGMRTIGPGASTELRLGYYVSPHFGILLGVRGSYGHALAGAGDSSTGYSVQVPVLFQIAATDRTRGVYFDFGVGLGTTYGGTAGDGVSYTLTSRVEGKFGIGYRIGGASSGAPRSPFSVDLNLGMDVGAINGVKVETSERSFSDTTDEPVHVALALSALLHFSL